MAFMREYGMLMGDPGSRPAPRRKSAAAGPRAKAGRKRVVRAQRVARGRQGSAKGPGKKTRGKGFDIGGLLQSAGQQLGKLRSGDLLGAYQAAREGPRKGGGFGKMRRSKNPANVKALRRALSRVEGFGKLVKRVNRMLPRAHKFQVHPVMKRAKRGKR